MSFTQDNHQKVWKENLQGKQFQNKDIILISYKDLFFFTYYTWNRLRNKEKCLFPMEREHYIS